MTYPTIAKAFVLSASILALLTPAKAADKDVVDSKGKPVIEATKESWITGDLGVTIVSRYYSRGILQERGAFIVQPNLDLFFKLYEGKGFINSVVLNLSLWDSIHSKDTHANADSTVGDWYESDYYVGLTTTFAKNFSLQASYFEFDYPGGAASPQRSANFQLSYNDSDLFGGSFGLHPHLTYLYNFEGVAGVARTHANYFEVGIAPSYTIAPKSAYPLTLTVPVTAGFGDSNFYPSDSFGYLAAGASASVPLAFISSHYGVWTFTVGGTYYRLGSDTRAINRNQADAAVASGTLSIAF